MIARDLQALFEFLEERLSVPFAWKGQRDCVSFSLEAVRRQTGIDLLEGIPRWNSRAQALSTARDLGGLEHALDERMARVPPALAKRGDVAALPDKLFGVGLMIVEGSTLVGPGKYGADRLPRNRMVQAWDIESIRAAAGAEQ